MTKPTKSHTKKELDLRQLALIEALKKTLGVVTTACKIVTIDPSTHYDWLKTNKTYKKAVKDIKNTALDFGESCLHKGMQKGNPLLIMFYLKCQGKERGFIEQNIVEIKGNMKFKADFGISNTIHSPSEAEGDSSFDK